MRSKKVGQKTSKLPKLVKPQKTQRKRKNLSKIEKFYIESKCSEMGLSEISSDLSLDPSCVKLYYEECKYKIESTKKDNGFTVMTQDTSEKSDATLKKTKNVSTKISRHIHKIRKDK